MESPVSGRMIESHQRQDDVPEFVAIAEALDYTRQSYFGRCVASEMPVGVSLIFEGGFKRSAQHRLETYQLGF